MKDTGKEVVEVAEEATDAVEKKEAVEADPYLLNDINFHAENPVTKWTNKQRTLLFASRGINAIHRHLLEDLKKLLPHHKTEAKWSKSDSYDMILEAAELANCNSFTFFEARKRSDLYMWLSRCPSGPCAKFQVLNISTMGDTNFTGNHIKFSRPLLMFDKTFAEQPQLALLKEMFVQIWGTPRFHPKSKPFHDHVLAFFFLDNNIWVRHYQIFSERFVSPVDKQTLVEVGPRFVLAPIRIFDNAFGGKTLWKNSFYVSPTAFRVRQKMELRKAVRQKQASGQIVKTKKREKNISKLSERSPFDIFGI